MTFQDWESSPSHRTGDDSPTGELSWTATLLIALLLIPLIFGGTLLLLNEIGQAYFQTHPIALPEQVSAAIETVGLDWLSAVDRPQIAEPSMSQPNDASAGSGAGAGSSTVTGTPESNGPDEQLTAAASDSAVPGASPSSLPSETPSGSRSTGTTAALDPSSTSSPTAASTASPPAPRTPTPTRTTTPTAASTTAPGSTATAVAASQTPLPATATSGSCSVTFNNGYEGSVFDLINSERQQQGLPAFTSDGRLQAAARTHASDMACNDFFSHTGSDGSNVGARVTAQGYSWSRVGENIYAGSGSYGAPSAAVEAWMDSPGHRANILGSDFTQIGIGYVYYANSTYRNYYVTVFAAPR